MYGSLGNLHWRDVRDLYLQSDGVCAYCKRRVGIANLSLDHVYPLNLGGSNTIENCVLCCRSCNSLKSNKTLEQIAGCVHVSIVASLLSVTPMAVYLRIQQGNVPGAYSNGNQCFVPREYVQDMLPPDFDNFIYYAELREQKRGRQ